MINVRLGLPHHRLAVAGRLRRLRGRADSTTGFKDKRRRLPPTRTAAATSARAAPGPGAQAGMQQIQQILGAQLEFTPFTGKYSLFGKLFAPYDFYAFVGPGLHQLRGDQRSVAPACDHGRRRADPAQPNVRCAVTGLKIGVNVRRRLPQLLRPVPWRSTSSCATSCRPAQPGGPRRERRSARRTTTTSPGRQHVRGFAEPRPVLPGPPTSRTYAGSVRICRTTPSGIVVCFWRPCRNVVAQEEGDALLQLGHAGRDAARGDPPGSLDLVDHPGRLADRA